ncbi:flagellar basal body-associated protein FliL [Rubrivirga sp. IMCC43871]|uniref:flagellar basal body-associated FliL family protein n=1 Tax=Rubrivirga sp. IMCC43871 TaxID=3391575 RepID=UPI00398FBAD4
MPDADAPAKAPRSKKAFLIPALALLVGAGGAVAVAQPEALRQLTGGAPADSTQAPVPVEFGQFAELDAVVVNPKGTGGRRYLMVKLGVEAEEAETLARLDELQPAAVDAVLQLLSAETVERLSDITLRDSLKDEIRTRFNTMLGEDGPVTRVYFTQYVLQ